MTLVPAGAHLFEMPAKLQLDQAAYFQVQAIYRGWAWFGVTILVAIAATLALALLERRRDRRAALAAAVAAFLLIIGLGVFFAWVFPTNQQTANWTTVVDDWENLRRRWEYGHAVAAILDFGALLAVARAVVSRDHR